jgi:hypothetical protein
MSRVRIIDVGSQVPTGSIRAIVAHLWADESGDYDRNPSARHIFRALSLVDEWLAYQPPERADAETVEVSSNAAHWGLCPVCHQNDGYLNVAATHWFVCHAHRMKWPAGENLFSSWRHETNDEWAENQHRLSDYAEVEPEWWPPDDEEGPAA